jgi:hypothetical protein
MALADTNKVGIYFNPEATWGETPSTPGMTQVRYTGESLAYTKQSVTSETIRDDRMRDQVALVGFNTEGDINFELSAFSFDSFFEAALSGTWSRTLTKTATTIAVNATTKQITDSGNGLGSIAVGCYIYPTGFTNAGNNRPRKVTAVAAGAITVEDTDNTLVTEASGSSRTLYATGVQATGDLEIVSPDLLQSTVLDFTTLGLSAGQKVRLTGFDTAANNGILTIAAISTNEIEFVEQTLVTEAAESADTISIYGRMLRNDTVARSFHLEKRFTDVTQFISFRGMRVGNMNFQLTAQEIITGAITFMGKTAALAQTTVAGSSYQADPTDVLTASANVGSIVKDGSTFSGALRSISLEIENNLRAQNQIGSTEAAGIGYGFLDVTGTIEAYFENEQLYEDLIDHDTVSLGWRMFDNDGNTYLVTLPKIYFTTGDPTAPGGNDDVILPLEYTAVRDATTDCMIQIDFLASPTV